MENIRKYCKEFKVKFEKLTDEGFIISFLVPIRAGMEIGTKNYKIKQVGKKRVFYSMICHSDNDITFGPKLNNL